MTDQELSADASPQDFKEGDMGLNKPAKLPRWADDGGEILEPSEAKKDIGFVSAERPTHQLLNWLQNLVYQWLDYFDKTSATKEDGVVSGAAKTSGFPNYLSAGATTRRFTILGATTPLVLQIDGVRYELESDLTLGSDLALAASSNNTGTFGEGDGTASTCYRGEYGGRLALSGVPGSNVEAEEALIQAYKISNGANVEYCLGKYSTTNVADPGYHFKPLIRGIAGTDRQPVTSASTVLTVLKAHWIFLNKDLVTIKTTANCPKYAPTAPSGPSTDDFWFNTTLRSWARYSGSGWVYENYAYIGIAICDSSHCVAVDCVDFVGIAWSDTLSYKKLSGDRYENNDYVRFHGPFEASVAGTLIHHATDFTVNGGSTESGNGGSPWFYIYLKPDGTFQCSPKGPRKKDWRGGWYHPSEYWRCVGLYNRNAYSTTTAQYDPESGICLMTYRNDIGDGQPGVFGYDILTGHSMDYPSVAEADYPNVPPIMSDFDIRLKAYATSGTVPNDIYFRPAVDSFMIHGYIPVHTVGALNRMETSFAHVQIECCVVQVSYFGNGSTSPLGYTTLQAHFAAGRIKF